jgi:monoamine oxidase
MSTEGLIPSAGPGNRRDFLRQMGAGFTGLALTSLLEEDGFFVRSAMASDLAAGRMDGERRPGRQSDARG